MQIIDVSGVKNIYPSQNISIQNTQTWNEFSVTLPQQYAPWTVETMELRVGYVSQNNIQNGKGVFLDNFRLYDELSWNYAQGIPDEVSITEDGLFLLNNEFYFPKFLWDTYENDFSASTLSRYQEIASLGFDGIYAPHSGIVHWGYYTKRELFRILDYAYEAGLKVIAHMPTYPSITDTKVWPAYQAHVEDWVETFSFHPALFGWYIIDELGPETLLGAGRSCPVSKWIHDKETAIGAVFHPTMLTTSEFPFTYTYDSYNERLAWNYPWAEHGNSNPWVPPSVIDFLYEYSGGGYIADIVSPNFYPMRSITSGDTPENLVSFIMDETYSAQLRHKIALKAQGTTPKNTLLFPFIQISREISSIPEPVHVRMMNAQALFHHAGGAMYYRDLNGNLYDLFGEIGAYLRYELPDVNEETEFLFNLKLQNRLDPSRKEIIYLDKTDAERSLLIDDKFILQYDRPREHYCNEDFGDFPALFCTGIPYDYRSRTMIRYPDLDINLAEKDPIVIWAQLRLFSLEEIWIKYSQPNKIPLRVLVGRWPDQDPDNIDWDEFTSNWNNIHSTYFDPDAYCDLPKIHNNGGWENFITGITVPEPLQTLIEGNPDIWELNPFRNYVQGIYLEIPLPPALIGYWRNPTFENPNEGLYLQPPCDNGEVMWRHLFRSTEYGGAQYYPQLELIFSNDPEEPIHSPFTYFEMCNDDHVETAVIVDRLNDPGIGDYALLAAWEVKGFAPDECIRIYSNRMKYPGAVVVYTPNGELLHTLNILPAKNYAVGWQGQGVCDEPGRFDMDGWYMFKDTFSNVPAVRIYKIYLE